MKFGIYFHDIGRKTDLHEPYHGEVSADMAKELIPAFINKSGYPNPDMDTIIFGIKYHSQLKKKYDKENHATVIDAFQNKKGVNKKIVETLWDADQLDHPRNDGFWKYLGKLDIDYLSTDYAKNFANSKEHLNKYPNCCKNK